MWFILLKLGLFSYLLTRCYETCLNIQVFYFFAKHWLSAPFFSGTCMALFIIRSFTQQIQYWYVATKRAFRRHQSIDTALSSRYSLGSELYSQNITPPRSLFFTYLHLFFTDHSSSKVTNCFKEFWEKEQEATNEDNKQGVAICFSYFR